MTRLQRWPKGFACPALILVQQLPSGMFFSCHIGVLQGPPYFLQDSNRHNGPTIKIRINSPGLPCTPPCLGCHQQRGEIWRKVPSRLFRLHSRTFKVMVQSSSALEDFFQRAGWHKHLFFTSFSLYPL